METKRSKGFEITESDSSIPHGIRALGGDPVQEMGEEGGDRGEGEEDRCQVRGNMLDEATSDEIKFIYRTIIILLNG